MLVLVFFEAIQVLVTVAISFISFEMNKNGFGFSRLSVCTFAVQVPAQEVAQYVPFLWPEFRSNCIQTKLNLQKMRPRAVLWTHCATLPTTSAPLAQYYPKPETPEHRAAAAALCTHLLPPWTPGDPRPSRPAVLVVGQGGAATPPDPGPEG